MRLSNAWQKVKFALCVVLCVAILLFCAWQLWSAWAYGAVTPFTRGRYDWITFQSSPGWFVGSVIGYLVVGIICAGLLALVLIDHRTGWRWRMRRELDTAIRQSPEER